jgi:hypothetical protein
MSKRRADKQLTDRNRPSEEEDDETMEMPQGGDGSWQDHGTASDATLAKRRPFIKAVRRGAKPLVAENDTDSKPSIFEIPKPAEKKEEKIETKTEEKKEETKENMVVESKPEAKTEAKTEAKAEEKKEAEVPKTTSPVPVPVSIFDFLAKSPFTFNFGGSADGVKWPTFQPTPLPTFTPNLPNFKLGGTPSTGANFGITWPTFPAASFNFDIVKKPEVTEPVSPNVSNKSTLETMKFGALEHSDLGKNAEEMQKGKDSILATPKKGTFGQDVAAPHSPVDTNSKISETTVSEIKPEKQENLVTGEEDEEVIFKSRVKLFEFEEGTWGNKGVGFAKLMKHKESSKTRLVMRVEGSGTVLLNIPIIPNMEVTYHQQKNIKFMGVNAKGEAPFKPGSFSLSFSVPTEKEEMYKHLNNAIATVPKSAAKTTETKEEEKK